MTAEIYIPGFTITCLMITAIICIVAVLAAWYTVRSRVKFSQIILGAFAYVLVMLLENLLITTSAIPTTRKPGNGSTKVPNGAMPTPSPQGPSCS